MGILDKAIFNEKYGSYTTPRGIITFAAVAKRWKNKDSKREDDQGAFILTLIVPATADLSVLKGACEALAKEKNGGKTKGLNSPFSDADEKLDEDRMPAGFEPEGWIMIRSNTYQKRPGVIFANGETVPEDELLDEVYNGRFARMTVKPHFYPAQDGGKPGVKLYLSNIQLLDRGEKWPGGAQRVEAHDEFESVEIDMDDDAGAVFEKKAKATKKASFEDDETGL